MPNLKPWQQPELDRLTRERVSARDHRLTCDDGRDRCEQHHGQECPFRVEQKERIFDRFGISQDQCTLPQIIESERGQHDDQPGKPDGAPAKMTQIGVERLRASDYQEHSAKRVERDDSMLPKERDTVPRVEREQDGWISGALPDTCSSYRPEPQ